MYSNILSALQGKRVKVEGKTQIITVEFSYSLKYNCNTVQITFNHIIKTNLGRHLSMSGYIYGCGKTLNDALYYLFNTPNGKMISEKQQKILNRIIKKITP